MIVDSEEDFLYLSDFVYCQRLIYFINLLEDKVFEEYVDMVKKRVLFLVN